MKEQNCFKNMQMVYNDFHDLRNSGKLNCILNCFFFCFFVDKLKNRIYFVSFYSIFFNYAYNAIINVDLYLIWCARRFSAITFIRYVYMYLILTIINYVNCENNAWQIKKWCLSSKIISDLGYDWQYNTFMSVILWQKLKK